jgi:hypothetical protein
MANIETFSQAKYKFRKLDNKQNKIQVDIDNLNQKTLTLTPEIFLKDIVYINLVNGAILQTFNDEFPEFFYKEFIIKNFSERLLLSTKVLTTYYTINQYAKSFIITNFQNPYIWEQIDDTTYKLYYHFSGGVIYDTIQLDLDLVIYNPYTFQTI